MAGPTDQKPLIINRNNHAWLTENFPAVDQLMDTKNETIHSDQGHWRDKSPQMHTIRNVTIEQ